MEDLSIFNFKVKSFHRSYPINFVEDFENSLYQSFEDGDMIIIDDKVLSIYAEKLTSRIPKSAYIPIIASEEQKSYQKITDVIDEIITRNFTKKNKLIAIGGGVIQDITAFISSILFRGVAWHFFPTTLLAQGDSCIGSKSSVNFGKYKNQLGGFYPPFEINIDIEFLSTLKAEEISSGLGEMCHYFLIGGEEDFSFYKEAYNELYLGNGSYKEVISKSLKLKKKMVELDEFDQNERQIFNYGHSFGHAIESMTDYGIPHGIAVSFGMDMANFVSQKKGYVTKEFRNEVRAFLKGIWKGYQLAGLHPQDMINRLAKDKKNSGSNLGLILTKGYGTMFKEYVTPDETFKDWIIEYFNTECK